MRLKVNPDTEFAAEIRKQLKANNNFCPCALEKTADTKCPCKDVRDMLKKEEKGMCHCGLYIVEEEK